MDSEHQIPRPATGRRRIAELRERKMRRSVAESIAKSRSMVIINLVILIASGFIMLVGVFYILRFLVLKQADYDPMVYKVGLAFIAIFTFSWITYLAMKIRVYILFLRESDSSRHPSELSDN